jgi:transcriptional antiterminator
MNKSDAKLKERALYIQLMYKHYTDVRKLRHIAIVELLADQLYVSVGTIEKDLRKDV